MRGVEPRARRRRSRSRRASGPRRRACGSACRRRARSRARRAARAAASAALASCERSRSRGARSRSSRLRLRLPRADPRARRRLQEIDERLASGVALASAAGNRPGELASSASHALFAGPATRASGASRSRPAQGARAPIPRPRQRAELGPGEPARGSSRSGRRLRRALCARAPPLAAASASSAASAPPRLAVESGRVTFELGLSGAHSARRAAESSVSKEHDGVQRRVEHGAVHEGPVAELAARLRKRPEIGRRDCRCRRWRRTAGRRGRSVVVSYQLRTCPSWSSSARSSRACAPRRVAELAEGDVAEVARGHRGEQVEADVGGRGPVGDHALGLLLIVVGREPVVRGGHEGLEEAPGLARAGDGASTVGGGERPVPRRDGLLTQAATSGARAQRQRTGSAEGQRPGEARDSHRPARATREQAPTHMRPMSVLPRARESPHGLARRSSTRAIFCETSER